MARRSLESATRLSKATERSQIVAEALRDGVAVAAKRWGKPERTVRRWVAEANKLTGGLSGARSPVPKTPEAHALADEIDAAAEALRGARRSTLGKLLAVIEGAAEAALGRAREDSTFDLNAVIRAAAGAFKLVGEVDLAERYMPPTPAVPAPKRVSEAAGELDAGEDRGASPPARSSASAWH